ncbi:M15 family metallopeptidase [uncultured Pseudoteredinibacter sp.]|uniref:M15 family metallopeptidase n=1 Tax=uncultured Pseudoteredinibacter sp. TaxID=1641701 RepID=UPI0026311EA2|nr:M15 family metallopeptidase [uncultured Pseudoteredinibacter sp.]
MKRRDLLVGFVAGAGVTGTGSYLLQSLANEALDDAPVQAELGDIDPIPLDPPSDAEFVMPHPADTISSAAHDANNKVALEADAKANNPSIQLDPKTPVDNGELFDSNSLSGTVIREKLPAMPAVDVNQAAGSEQAQQIVSQDREQVVLVDPNAEGDINLDKVKFFENEFHDDVYLPKDQRRILLSVALRLGRAQKIVGHGNFNVLGFDEVIRFGRKYSKIGRFTDEELAFMEMIFETQASEYGFFGEKVSGSLSDRIAKKDIVKVPYSGHYLFAGDSLNYYNKLKKDVGKNIILTSGIRSNVKQMMLFLNKAVESEFNLSKASRSLAPPGHSFHGIGDFDVGRIGWGAKNFTDQFAQTREFKTMEDLGYVQIRYTTDNRLGVRYEPWHIKVV